MRKTKRLFTLAEVRRLGLYAGRRRMRPRELAALAAEMDRPAAIVSAKISSIRTAASRKTKRRRYNGAPVYTGPEWIGLPAQ